MRKLASPQFHFEFHDELIVDNFAGGGGASLGIEMGFGRHVDIAINHDEEAIAMHTANHPHTRHYCESVWDIDPIKVTNGKPVGLAWFSPDCKHFSKAKGGKPVEKKIRGLAWIVIRWAAKVRPRVIMLENVEEFQDWGPLTAENKPDKSRKGETFRLWKKQLTDLGYHVEHRELRACDYGAPTIRKRFFLIARCDNQPIIWPEKTHGKGLLPYKTAADCIDWSIPCPSIFERKKPLAENTLKRIAKGLEKFVINHPDPFIISYYGDKKDRPGEFRGQKTDQPLPTQTTENRFGLVTPYIARIGQTGSNGHLCKDVEEPISTIVSKAEHMLIAPHIVKHFGGAIGADITRPFPTVMGRGTQSQLVTSHLLKLRNNQFGQDHREPMPTLTAGGGHYAEVRAFLIKYYSTGGQWQDLREPMHTMRTKECMGLVTVNGEPHQIVDIGMRMLTPRELYRAQSFTEDYIIELDHKGQPLTKTAQVRMCGNSVPPLLAKALVEANCGIKHQEARVYG